MVQYIKNLVCHLSLNKSKTHEFIQKYVFTMSLIAHLDYSGQKMYKFIGNTYILYKKIKVCDITTCAHDKLSCTVLLEGTQYN